VAIRSPSNSRSDTNQPRISWKYTVLTVMAQFCPSADPESLNSDMNPGFAESTFNLDPGQGFYDHTEKYFDLNRLIFLLEPIKRTFRLT
jgi:hypothetical protein